MRKIHMIIIVLLALLVLASISTALRAEKSRLDADTMKAALRTTTIEENGFIDYVLTKVSKGLLPADLVDSTFQWARKKPYRHRFQYFRQGLIVRAAKLGIEI